MNGVNRFIGDVSRRQLLKTGAFATGVALVGGASGSAVALPADWEELSLKEQLRVVRRATTPYKRLEEMDAAGYVSANLPLVCSEGLHFDKLSLWEDGVLDPENPESLFYMVNDGGKLVLGGAEFILVTELDENDEPVAPKPDLFNDEDEPLDSAPLLGTSEADGWIPIVDPATGFAIWDLHVWVHEKNPLGVFSLPNPRFADMPGCVPLEDLL